MTGNEPPVHIVALHGSVRHGNTETLMRMVARGCEAAGAEVEWIHLADLDLRYCRSCMQCLVKGVCLLEDDLAWLRGRLLAADGVIAGSPVYEGGPSAIMKNLMDRFALLVCYTDLFRQQRCVGVATSGMAPGLGVARQLASFFGIRSATVAAHVAGLRSGYRDMADREDSGAAIRAKQAGIRLVRDIEHPPSRLRTPPERLWLLLLRSIVLRRLVYRNRTQFSAVIQAWSERGAA
jgi:multimeric flavodoxin WrbA